LRETLEHIDEGDWVSAAGSLDTAIYWLYHTGGVIQAYMTQIDVSPENRRGLSAFDAYGYDLSDLRLSLGSGLAFSAAQREVIEQIRHDLALFNSQLTREILEQYDGDAAMRIIRDGIGPQVHYPGSREYTI
jgi:hypothetical protein